MLGQDPKISRRSFLKLMGLMGANAFLFGAGGMVYAKSLEPAWVEVNQVKLKLPRLGKAFDGFRMVQVSDIHMGGWMNEERFTHIMDLVLEQKPDLLAISGDFVHINWDRTHLGGSLVELGNVFAKMGDFLRVGVLGNHDLVSGPEDIRSLMEKHQIRDLTNAVFSLERGADRLHLAGVDDLREGAPDLEKVLRVLPEDGASILVSHEPDFADQSAPSGRFDLQISGHTHGGQVVVPLLGPPMLPDGGKKYYDGLYKVGTMLQYTNRGVGMTWPFVRFNCRPEITVYTLQAGA
jgi:uncharacterized protein